jgi:DNA helicase-2/ATP-dependent DNA helicase PcrA
MEGFEKNEFAAGDESHGSSVPFLDDLPPDEAVGMYHLGDRVRHEKFGTGMVIQCRQEGQDQRLTVSFMNFGRKQLMASKAKLERLSRD